MVKFNYFSDADFNRGKDAIALNGLEIQELVDDVTKYLQIHEVPNYSLAATGDTIVFGTSNGENGVLEEMNIYVCRNYEEANAFLENGRLQKMCWEDDYWCHEWPEYNPNKEI